MKNYSNKKAVTLIELFISISLFATIVLAAVAFDLASRRFLRSSEEEIMVLNELGLIIDYIHQDVSRATGDLTNIGLIWDETNFDLTVRIDINDPVTPSDYTDDAIITYDFNGVNLTRDGHQLTNHLVAVVAADLEVDPSLGGLVVNGLRLERTINGVVYAVEMADISGADTMFFFPLSHSW